MKPFQSKQPTRPIGRPTQYKPEFCQMLIKHMGSGLSFECFAGVDGVDVCTDTLYEWLKKFPDFADAKRIGTSKAKMFWESQGVEGLWHKTEFNNATKMTNTKSMNDRIWKFNMVNRFGWSDKKEVITSEEKPKKLVISFEDDKSE